MDFGARDPAAEHERKSVVGAAFADVGVDRREVKGVAGFVLQPDVRQMRAGADGDLGDGVVQIAACTRCDFQHDQRRAGAQMDGMARMQRVRSVAVAVDPHDPRVHPGGHAQDGAVLGQHGVQRDHRIAIRAGKGAEYGIFSETREAGS